MMFDLVQVRYLHLITQYFDVANNIVTEASMKVYLSEW